MTFLPEDDARLRTLLDYSFGFFVVIVYAILAIVLGIGHVEEKTSYGLSAIMEALKPLGVLWAGYMFGKRVGEATKKSD